MKIAIEATPLYQNRNIPRAGISQYIYQVVSQMIYAQNKDSYTLFANKFGGGELPESLKKKNINSRVIKYIPGKAWNLASRKNILLPYEIFHPQYQDAIWFTNFRTYSTLRRVRRITSVYDVAFSIYPEYIQTKNLAYLQDQVPRTVRLADKIVTISKSAKHDIVERFGANPDNIVIAPCGVDTSFFRPVKNKRGLRDLGITKDYVLHVGTIEPRKNLAALIRAYDAMPESYRDHYDLVLAGGRGWNDKEIWNEIHKQREVGKVIATGYVEESVIPSLYTHATALLYPSFYEGFGLPILEALACGTPVLTAKNSSLEEVAKDAAYYVDEFSEDSISAGICKLLDSSTLRNRIVQLGQSRVAKYQWASAAKTIHEALVG